MSAGEWSGSWKASAHVPDHPDHTTPPEAPDRLEIDIGSSEVLNCSNSTIDTIPCDFNEKALRYKRLLNVRETMLHARPVKLPEEIARGKPILRWFLACFQRNKPLRRTHSTMAPYLKISEAGIHVIRGYTFQSSCAKLLWHTVAHIAG